MKVLINQVLKNYIFDIDLAWVVKKSRIQGVSAKTFEPNISVICQRIFMKFKMQIF
jgi:hypothetical protein